MAIGQKEKVTTRNIAAVVRFLPLMKRSDFLICSTEPCEEEDCDCLPQVRPTQEGISFIQAVEKNTTTLQGSLREWGVTREARDLLTSVTAIGEADAMQLMKLLALHVRADRYVRGHLQEALNSGHIPAILTRLEEILGDVRSRRRSAV